MCFLPVRASAVSRREEATRDEARVFLAVSFTVFSNAAQLGRTLLRYSTFRQWVLVTVFLLTGGAASAQSAMELWYREVFVGGGGDPAEALGELAQEYENIYIDRPGSKRESGDLKRLAALRAGICFERLRRFPAAAQAYDRLRSYSSSEPELRGPDDDRTHLRVTGYRERFALVDASVKLLRDSSARDTSASSVHPLNSAVADLTASLQRGLTRNRARLTRLQKAQGLVRKQLQATNGSCERLRASGAVLAVGSVSPPEEVASQPIDGDAAKALEILVALDKPADLALAALTNSTLEAISLRGVRTAAHRLRVVRVLDPGNAVTNEIRESLETWADARSLARLARTRLDVERWRRLGELQSQLRAELWSARDNESQRFPLRQLQRLDGIRERLGWSLPVLTAEAEIVDLAREAELLLLTVTNGAEGQVELIRLWEARRRQVRDEVTLALGLVDDVVNLLQTEEQLISLSRSAGERSGQ